MAFTARQLTKMLNELGFRSRNEEISAEAHEAGYALVSARFRMQRFKDPVDGENHAQVKMVVAPKGHALELHVCDAYHLTNARNRGRTFMAALQVCARTYLVQAQWHPASEMLGFSVEMPVEDGTITKAQLNRMISALLSAIDLYDPVMRLAAEEGVIDFSSVDEALEQDQHQDEDEDEDD